MPRKPILIVEDEESIREVLCLVLEAEGYPVLAARHGKEALDLLKRNETPGVILLDLMMPVMDGWAFLEAARKDFSLSGIPVIVVTAFKEKAKEIKGVAGALIKPISIDTLLRAVEPYCCEKTGAAA